MGVYEGIEKTGVRWTVAAGELIFSELYQTEGHETGQDRTGDIRQGTGKGTWDRTGQGTGQDKGQDRTVDRPGQGTTQRTR